MEVLEKFTAELETRLSYSMRAKFHFQQDGAPPYTSKLALDWLKTHFNNRVISRKTDFEWAPHSPDLSPPDFFLWGYLKDRVYKTNPQTIGELKRNIQTEMEAIDEATCRAVMSNFIRRMKMRVSIRKEDTWSNCCRTGYTPVKVLIFYVTVFILIKSIFFNFCFILSIFVIMGFFLNNFQKRQPQFFLL